MTEVIPANTTFQSHRNFRSGRGGMELHDTGGGRHGRDHLHERGLSRRVHPARRHSLWSAKVNAGTATGTQITDTISATSDTNDPILANNSATVLTIVGAANTANLRSPTSVSESGACRRQHHLHGYGDEQRAAAARMSHRHFVVKSPNASTYVVGLRWPQRRNHRMDLLLSERPSSPAIFRLRWRPAPRPRSPLS